MTPIGRRVRRAMGARVYSRGRSRAVVVILEPPGAVIGLRLLGERKTYYAPLDWLYRSAVAATVRAERAAEKVRVQS